MILVTGANGFIGSCMIWQLNEKNASESRGPVIAVDSVSQKDRPLPLAKRKIDRFLDKDRIWPFLQQNAKEVRWIVHLGACSSTTETDVEYLRENNTEYTRKLFVWCRDNGVPFIYASSGAVYGDGADGFSDETDPARFTPLNPYGESKAAFDRWVVNEEVFPAAWYGLRFFNVYGPGEEHKGDMASVVFKAFHQIRNGGKLKLFRSHNPRYPDGGQERDFVYVKDITRWIAELMDKKPRSGIYNMGYGKPRTWLDLASAVFKEMDRPMNIDWIDIPENIRGQYQYTTCATTKKWLAQDMSGPVWTLEDGIRDYMRFLLSGQRYL